MKPSNLILGGFFICIMAMVLIFVIALLTTSLAGVCLAIVIIFVVWIIVAGAVSIMKYSTDGKKEKCIDVPGIKIEWSNTERSDKLADDLIEIVKKYQKKWDDEDE